MEDKHILVSLGDEKAKAISEVIGNKSCNKILDYLVTKESSVSEISVNLDMPINTVDYNVKKLVRAGLIEKSSHWWSVKGKKMPVYRVSNKQIIISPKKSLASVFAWVVGLSGFAALTIRQMTRDLSSKIVDSSGNFAKDLSEVALLSSPERIVESQVNSGGFLSFFASLGPWSWFLFGTWFAIFMFFAVILIKQHRIR